MPLSAPLSKTLGVGLALLLSACAQGPSVQSSVSQFIRPYTADVLQGNVITQERVSLLKVGMRRADVAAVLGTPLLKSVFHADRWDYVFRFERQGEEVQQRHLSVFFNGDRLERFEGDEMPKESEFVQAIARPVAEIDPATLQPQAPESSQAPAPAAQVTPDASPSATPQAEYPPLTSGSGLIQ